MAPLTYQAAMLQDPEIQELQGYLLIRFNANQWAQIPRGFGGETIPDEYIFDPEWNRMPINDWWRRQQVKAAGAKP